MLEPVSIAFLSTVGFAGIGNHARTSSAISTEAAALRAVTTEVAESIEASQALFGHKEAVISQLMKLADECAEPDWDGAGASPVSPESVVAAETFIRMLPESIPLPELTLDPDGCVSLDWITSRNRMFTLSVGNSGRLSFAWIDGTDRGHGVARFNGDAMPQRVLEGIRSIVTNGHTSVRA